MIRTARRWFAPTRLALVGVVTALLSLLMAGAPAAAAPAGESGWVRLAHFSPDTPQVDVYLTSFSDPQDPTVIPGVGYGTLSQYQRLAAGRYSVGMRLAGADAASPPVVTTDVAVRAGRAYTVAGVGRNADLALEVLNDDLSAPPPGQARLRVIQASAQAPVITLTEGSGATLAEATKFATTSPYVSLAAGERKLQLRAAAQPVAAATLRAAEGAVYSLVVLDEGPEVAIVVRNDARSAAQAPRGGVAAGTGGLAGAGGGPGAPVAVAAACMLALGATVLVRRTRRLAACSRG